MRQWWKQHPNARSVYLSLQTVIPLDVTHLFSEWKIFQSCFGAAFGLYDSMLGADDIHFECLILRRLFICIATFLRKLHLGAALRVIIACLLLPLWSNSDLVLNVMRLKLRPQDVALDAAFAQPRSPRRCFLSSSFAAQHWCWLCLSSCWLSFVTWARRKAGLWAGCSKVVV